MPTGREAALLVMDKDNIAMTGISYTTTRRAVWGDSASVILCRLVCLPAILGSYWRDWGMSGQGRHAREGGHPVTSSH